MEIYLCLKHVSASSCDVSKFKIEYERNHKSLRDDYAMIRDEIRDALTYSLRQV
jgi:hypothetical protein